MSQNIMKMIVEYMNIRIFELIFIEREEREFSLMSEAHEKIAFWTDWHSKNLLTIVYWTETRLSVLKEVLMEQVKITHVMTATSES